MFGNFHSLRRRERNMSFEVIGGKQLDCTETFPRGTLIEDGRMSETEELTLSGNLNIGDRQDVNRKEVGCQLLI